MTGLAHHRVLDVDEVVTSPGVDQAATEPAPAVTRPVYDWEVANDRKREAIAELEPLSAVMDDIDARVKELLARVEESGSGDR